MKLIKSFFELLWRHKKTLLLIFFVSTTTLLISSGISIWLSDIDNLSIPSIGIIKTIGVEAYSDQNYETKTELLDWETLWPGSTNNITLYLRSVSNVKTNLHLNLTNITPPSISEYIKLSWNYDGRSLNPDETIQVTLFLSASTNKSFIKYLIDNEVTDFNLEIHITAYE